MTLKARGAVVAVVARDSQRYARQNHHPDGDGRPFFSVAGPDGRHQLGPQTSCGALPKRSRGQAPPLIIVSSLDQTHLTWPPSRPASCLPAARITRPRGLRFSSTQRWGPSLFFHDRTLASLKLDGTFATPSPGPRSWRETSGKPNASSSRGLSWPYLLDFECLNVHEPPPHLRQHVWTPGGTQYRTSTDPRAPRILFGLNTGSIRHHTLHHPANMSRFDEASVWPLAQPQQTPGHIYVPPATTSGPSVAHKPNTAVGATAPSPGDHETRHTDPRPTWTPKAHAASDDAFTDDPCPVLALATVRPDARTTTWRRLLPAGWKRGFSQADLRRLRTTRSSLRALVFRWNRRERNPNLFPEAALCVANLPPAARQLPTTEVARPLPSPEAPFFRGPGGVPSTLALLLGLDSDAGGSLKLSASLPSTSVEPAMDGGASFLGSTGRFSARTRCDLNSRISSIHWRRRCKFLSEPSLGSWKPTAFLLHVIFVDGICIPHFLEVRTFPYVNLLVGRLAVVSLVGLRKLRLRPLCATCSCSVLPHQGLQAASLFRVRELEQTHVLFTADIMNRGGPFPRWQ